MLNLSLFLLLIKAHFIDYNMIHKPIQIKNLSLSLPHKICFENFNISINYGSRIAIIGRNGSGKTTLLKILQGNIEPTSGTIECSDDVVFGYVPQAIENFSNLSGGQSLNKSITKALSFDPNVLLLDEPTNHLDLQNRKSLMLMLKSYHGTLIVVSHNTELLRNCISTLWHIDNEHIHVFSGNYDDYIREIGIHRTSIEYKLLRLDRQKKDMHDALMNEQKRASKSKAKGKKSIAQSKWPTVVSTAKASRAQETSGNKKSAIDNKKQYLTAQLRDMMIPEIIIPKFSIPSENIRDSMILSISDASVSYKNQNSIISIKIIANINFSLRSKERIAIQGDNASGKSTLIKAVLGNDSVIKNGNWVIPKLENIGYLDQHYSTLLTEKTVLETIAELVPNWSHLEVRRHLNDFLFRKNDEVKSKVSSLSGGEKARLSLAQIAAITPKLLILDEITNNLDLETRNHTIEVLKSYPGAMIIISHDRDFLKEVGINDYYQVVNGYFSAK